MWPDVLDRVKQKRRFTHILLSGNAQVIGVEGHILTLGFLNDGARDSFRNTGSDNVLREALLEFVGAAFDIEAVTDVSAKPGDSPITVTTPAVRDPEPSAPVAAPEPPTAEPEGVAEEDLPDPETIAAARENIRQTRTAGEPAIEEPAAYDPDADVDPDDADASNYTGAELLQRELGATVIDTINHEE